MKQIHYSKGYKYQLDEDYVHVLLVPVPHPIDHPFFRICGTELIVKVGYAWDGPSGPTIDTDTFMRGSLVHDVLYQCIVLKLIPMEYKDAADDELVLICYEDYMSAARRWWVGKGLDIGGDEALAHGPKPVLVSPKKQRVPLHGWAVAT